MPKKTRTVAKHPEFDLEEAVASFLLNASSFFDRVIRPNLAVGGTVLLAVVLIVLITVGVRSHARSAAEKGLVKLQRAKGLEALAEVAREHNGTLAGELASLRRARLLFEQEKYADAAKYFSMFMSDYPDSHLRLTARLGEAYAMEADGRIAQAQERFETLATEAAAPTSVGVRPLVDMRFECSFSAGRCAKSRGRFDEAEKHLTAALAAAGDDERFSKRAESALSDVARLRAEGASPTAGAAPADVAPAPAADPTPTAAAPAAATD